MTDQPTAAGGFFLVVAILAGFVIGVYGGQPLLGTIAGTIVGIALAVIVWLRDRKRAR